MDFMNYFLNITKSLEASILNTGSQFKQLKLILNI
jgi:hypothetical protein